MNYSFLFVDNKESLFKGEEVQQVIAECSMSK